MIGRTLNPQPLLGGVFVPILGWNQPLGSRPDEVELSRKGLGDD